MGNKGTKKTESNALLDGPDYTCTWLHRHQAPRCLLFFAGWGMDSKPFSPLASGGLDVCMLSNYQRLVPPQLPELAGYEEVHLLAWSFGVWVASQVAVGSLRSLCKTALALGGTLNPVHERYGLAPERFAAMLAGCSEESVLAFYSSMFDEPRHLASFLAVRPQRGPDDLQKELVTLYNGSMRSRASIDIFTHHCITGRDRIFAGRNQIRAWGREDDSRVFPWPHFPFSQFNTWRELLETLRFS